MIRRFSNDSDEAHRRHCGVSMIVRLAFFGAILLPLCARAGSIFDDDWTPPPPTKPVAPPADTPEVKPAPGPVKPDSPEPVKPNTPEVKPAPEPVKPDAPADVPATPAAAPAARKPIPAPAARAKAHAIFDEVYAKEMADHSPAARRALAKKLIGQAATMNDSPTDQFMLLIGATAAGKEGSDLYICFRAADAMAETFDIDPLRFKSQTAAKVKFRADMPAITADNCQAAMELIDQLLAAGDYVNAQAVLKALRASAPDPGLTSQIQSRAKALDTLRAADERIAPFLQKLQTSPDDATANLEVGKYQCFIKGDWKQGLPLLVKSGNAGLSSVATLDLAGASDPQKKAELGDAWWDLADKETGQAQSAMQQRAISWYGPALDGKTLSGLKRVVLEKRVAAVAAGAGAGGFRAGSPPLTVINRTDAREGAKVLAAALARYPDDLKGINKAELVKYHDGSEFHRNGKAMPDAYSAMPASGGGGGIWLWGIYEKWEPGKYVVIYRVQGSPNVVGDNICFLDVCTGGNTISGRRPKSTEFDNHRWMNFPLILDLHEARVVEYRLWPNGHAMALDRIYIYKIP